MDKTPAKKRERKNEAEPSERKNRRNQIVSAAEKVLRDRGLSGMTTRLIAQEVGCSEGALYVHFKNRLELLLTVLEENLPDMRAPLQRLRESVNSQTPQHNLEIAVRGVYTFHKRVTPMLASLFAEPALLAKYRSRLMGKSKGPHLSIGAFTDYIRAEQDLGRVNPLVDPGMAAHLLMSNSFFRAFCQCFFGEDLQPAWNEFVHDLVASIIGVSRPN